jgi:hypothetical protein
MRYSPRQLSAPCPGCGQTSLTCNLIMRKNEHGRNCFQYVHICTACEYIEESAPPATIDAGPVVCAFCKEKLAVADGADNWLFEVS